MGHGQAFPSPGSVCLLHLILTSKRPGEYALHSISEKWECLSLSTLQPISEMMGRACRCLMLER